MNQNDNNIKFYGIQLSSYIKVLSQQKLLKTSHVYSMESGRESGRRATISQTNAESTRKVGNRKTKRVVIFYYQRCPRSRDDENAERTRISYGQLDGLNLAHTLKCARERTRHNLPFGKSNTPLLSRREKEARKKRPKEKTNDHKDQAERAARRRIWGGGGESMESRSSQKCLGSRCSFVSKSEGLIFPSM